MRLVPRALTGTRLNGPRPDLSSMVLGNGGVAAVVFGTFQLPIRQVAITTKRFMALANLSFVLPNTQNKVKP